MLPFVLATALAAEPTPALSATFLPGMTAASVSTAASDVEVARFTHDGHDWTLTCKKGKSATSPTCKAGAGEEVRTAKSATIDGTKLTVVFEGSQTYKGFNVEIKGT